MSVAQCFDETISRLRSHCSQGLLRFAHALDDLAATARRCPSPGEQAQSSGAQVVGLANAGADFSNSLKAANESGLTNTMKPAALLAFITDIHALGLETAHGLYLTAAWYWDLNDKSRALGERFFDGPWMRFNLRPTRRHRRWRRQEPPARPSASHACRCLSRSQVLSHTR